MKKNNVNEMELLINLLKVSKIPFEITECWGTPQVRYPSSENCICDAICHSWSYGYEDGLLEIMGLVNDDDNDVEGYLTAFEVFGRIQKHYLLGF